MIALLSRIETALEEQVNMPNYAERILDLKQSMVETALDAVLLTKPENLYYFTGFWGAAPIRLLSLLVSIDGDSLLLVPKLEEEYARTASWVKDVRTYTEFVPGEAPQEPADCLKRILEEDKLDHSRIGLEFDSLPVSAFARLRACIPQVDWLDASPLVARLRMLKSTEEIEKVRGACRLADRKVAVAAETLRLGDSELEIGITLAYEAALESGFLISPYNAGVPVVATGPRSALPHGRASQARVTEGDLLVMDLCAIAFYEAYHAGFTRTFSIGRPGQRESDIYRVVREANIEAINAVRPGVLAEEIDEVARAVIRKAGYGEYFTHRTGRGVGLDVSEPPYLRQGDRTVLEPGMTIVVEPGIYMDGLGGVRIEDTVLVTETGHERLTRFPNRLIDVLDQEIE